MDNDDCYFTLMKNKKGENILLLEYKGENSESIRSSLIELFVSSNDELRKTQQFKISCIDDNLQPMGGLVFDINHNEKAFNAWVENNSHVFHKKDDVNRGLDDTGYCLYLQKN